MDNVCYSSQNNSRVNDLLPRFLTALLGIPVTLDLNGQVCKKALP